MSNHAEHAAQRRSVAPPARLPAENVESPAQLDASVSGEITALRDDAATLEFIARRWARVLPAHRNDVRIDIARLREIAGNARGFARTMEGSGMTRITLTLPALWTPTMAREQMDRYERLVDEHHEAIESRDMKRQHELEMQMCDIADELIEAAVLHGTWSVEDAT